MKAIQVWAIRAIPGFRRTIPNSGASVRAMARWCASVICGRIIDSGIWYIRRSERVRECHEKCHARSSGMSVTSSVTQWHANRVCAGQSVTRNGRECHATGGPQSVTFSPLSLKRGERGTESPHKIKNLEEQGGADSEPSRLRDILPAVLDHIWRAAHTPSTPDPRPGDDARADHPDTKEQK